MAGFPDVRVPIGAHHVITEAITEVAGFERTMS